MDSDFCKKIIESKLSKNGGGSTASKNVQSVVSSALSDTARWLTQVDVDIDGHVILNTPDSEDELMSLYIMTLHPLCLYAILNCRLFVNDDTLKQTIHATRHYCVSTDTLSLEAFFLCCYLPLISYPLFCNKLFISRRGHCLPGRSRVLRSRPGKKK